MEKSWGKQGVGGSLRKASKESSSREDTSKNESIQRNVWNYSTLYFLKNDSRGVKTEPNNMLVALEAESVSYFMF